MSAQTMHDALCEWEAHYKAEVMHETWGHLAPKKNKAYKGKVVYAVGCFGDDHLNPTPLVCEFEDLDSSPWFYDALMDFIQEQENKIGCIYEFNGVFQNYIFDGTIKLLQNYDA